MMAACFPDGQEQFLKDPASVTADRQYNSTFASKGALLADVKTVLREIDAGQGSEQMRDAVIKDDFLDRGTLHNRRTVWREISRRYISGRDRGHVATLARFVTRCPNPTAVDLVLFYEYCQVDLLLYDLTVRCTHELYQDARAAMDQVDANEWLKRQETTHREIATWSPTTRSRLVRSYLATIRDFGLVTGTKRKEFHKLYVPREAFVYALYHQKERGIHGKALIHSTDWRLFLLSEAEVIFLLEDAANGGFVHFRRAGDIYDLRFVYNDLPEVVHAIVDR
jgi:hypothetical protein